MHLIIVSGGNAQADRDHLPKNPVNISGTRNMSLLRGYSKPNGTVVSCEVKGPQLAGVIEVETEGDNAKSQ